MKPALSLLAVLAIGVIILVTVRQGGGGADASGDPIEDSYTVGIFLHQVLYPAMQRPEFARDPGAVLHTLKDVTLDGGTRIHYRSFAITVYPSRTSLAAYGPFTHTTATGPCHTTVLLQPDGEVVWNTTDDVRK